jgi:hypothetical protein
VAAYGFRNSVISGEEARELVYGTVESFDRQAIATETISSVVKALGALDRQAFFDLPLSEIDEAGTASIPGHSHPHGLLDTAITVRVTTNGYKHDLTLTLTHQHQNKDHLEGSTLRGAVSAL